ncbi:MAG: hypothetical protein KDD44_06000 [Bdellovibrionales bacterium]|nr:hypothetical protein [Bdellovibrionales bacterium]
MNTPQLSKAFVNRATITIALVFAFLLIVGAAGWMQQTLVDVAMVAIWIGSFAAIALCLYATLERTRAAFRLKYELFGKLWYQQLSDEETLTYWERRARENPEAD